MLLLSSSTPSSAAPAASSQRGSKPGQTKTTWPTNADTAIPSASTPTSRVKTSTPPRRRTAPPRSRSSSATVHLHATQVRLDVDQQRPPGGDPVPAEVGALHGHVRPVLLQVAELEVAQVDVPAQGDVGVLRHPHVDTAGADLDPGAHRGGVATGRHGQVDVAQVEVHIAQRPLVQRLDLAHR